MFPATMIHRSGAARIRVNSQEDIARLGAHWHMEVLPEPPVAVVEPEAVAVSTVEPRKRGRPRKGS